MIIIEIFIFFKIYRVFHKMLYQTPSPQRKKDPPPRENKIRLFLKRSSEPLLNLQNAAQQVLGTKVNSQFIKQFSKLVVTFVLINEGNKYSAIFIIYQLTMRKRDFFFNFDIF